MMKRALIGVAVCGASILGVGAGSALAGEIQGNGVRNFPVHQHPGNSICAYSGQNDEYHEVSKILYPRVQSWGQDVKVIVEEGGAAVGGHLGVPGDACNPRPD